LGAAFEIVMDGCPRLLRLILPNPGIEERTNLLIQLGFDSGTSGSTDKGADGVRRQRAVIWANECDVGVSRVCEKAFISWLLILSEAFLLRLG
jgi:hypothetical protein